MSKRKISEDLACHGCQDQFDTGTGAAFGDCGHSLCPACVNEKIESCPICSKEGGSTSKQKNDLAIGLLASGAENEEAEQSKKPRMFFEEETCAADEPIPAIVNPENRSFLAEIVNKLDPRSFLKLSRSCKYLHSFCFNSKDVKIIYNIPQMLFLSAQDEVLRGGFGGHGRGLASSSDRKKLKNYPFRFHLTELLIFNDLDEEFIGILRSFFAEFPFETIEILCASIVSNWQSGQQFLKDFHIKDVWVGDDSWFPWFEYDPIPEDVLAYILQNTVRFNGYGNVPDHLLLNASVKKLELLGTKISQPTFFNLIKRFANSTEEITWKFGEPSFGFGHYELFKVLPLEYEQPLPEERPLIFAKSGDNDRFYILRNDGKVLRCANIGFNIEFSTNKSYGYPPVFDD